MDSSVHVSAHRVSWTNRWLVMSEIPQNFKEFQDIILKRNPGTYIVYSYVEFADEANGTIRGSLRPTVWSVLAKMYCWDAAKV